MKAHHSTLCSNAAAARRQHQQLSDQLRPTPLTPPDKLSKLLPSMIKIITRLLHGWTVEPVTVNNAHTLALAVHTPTAVVYLYPWSPLGALQLLIEEHEAEHG
jgi:hypothetical protein